jgi:5-methylcytosine-specific restriction endonuclease McrA
MAERIYLVFYSPSPIKANRAGKSIAKRAEKSGVSCSGPISRDSTEVSGYEIREKLVLFHDVEHSRFKKIYDQQIATPILEYSDTVHLEIGYNSHPEPSWSDKDLTELFDAELLEEAAVDNSEITQSSTEDSREQESIQETSEVAESDSMNDSTEKEQNDRNKPISELRDEAKQDSTTEVNPDAVNAGDQVQYSRSQKVRDYVLRRADGQCEGCGEPAPFESKTGDPYLHAHHVHELSEGGSDSPETVIALCPNCHYRVHHGKDGSEYNEQLISRLEQIEY